MQPHLAMWHLLAGILGFQEIHSLKPLYGRESGMVDNWYNYIFDQYVMILLRVSQILMSLAAPAKGTFSIKLIN